MVDDADADAGPLPMPGEDDTVPRYRSGAVARMLRMPVATLRIWERRYRVAAPATAPSGHRLYSAADVKRLALMRQLTELGHAIGSLAGLDMAALRQVALTHAGALAAPRRGFDLLGETPAAAASGAAVADPGTAPDAAAAPATGPATPEGAARAAAPGAGAGPVPRAGAVREGAAQEASLTNAAAPAAVTAGPAPDAPAPARELAAAAAAAVLAGPPVGAVAATPAARGVEADAPWRVVVVSGALARRLERSTVRGRLGRPLAPAAQFETLEEAARLAQAPQPVAAEALLVQVAGLRPEHLPLLLAAARACGAQRVHVLYGFASAALCEAFQAAGVALLRGPQDDRALASWLQASCCPLTLPPVVAPRRWDDAALADFAGLSSTIACECPRHVAELLMQLSAFEAYSGECAQRSPADAALHAHLGQVSATARALFEEALERIAVQEGLMLPGGTG